MSWLTDTLGSALAAINPMGRYGPNAPATGIFSHQLALAAYQSSGLLRKVIRIPAEDRVREWRDWQADKDAIALIEAEEKRLSLVAKIEQAETMRGIGGGALILVTAGDHAQPLDAATLRKGGLIAINLVSRWQIRGKDWVRELTSPDYGRPLMWEMDGNATTATRIHPSRVICFRGKTLPSGSALSDEDAFWGDPRIVQVMREVERSDHAQAWFSALVKKAKLLRIGISNLTDYEPSDLDKRVALIATGENSLNASIYNLPTKDGVGNEAGGEKIDDYQVAWTGIPAMMDAFDQRVAAVADIPFTRLMGRSPAGMNATGAYDDQNWAKTISAGQQLETRPCLEAFDEALIRSAGVADPAKVTWKWAPLWAPTESEEATTFKTFMEAIEKVQASATIPDQAFSEAFQNWMEEREYMPGLSAALAKVPEAERFGLMPDAEEDDPSQVQTRGGDPDLSGTGASLEAEPRRRAANDAWMLEDWAAKPLYVRRDVLNRADIVQWAKSQGFTDIVPDLHVTITYSETPVDWMAMGESWRGKLEIEAGGPRLVEGLGPDGKYKALLFTAYELISRNQEMRDKGASFSWAEYQPHISIQIGGDIDLASVKPYTGKIVLGPEIFEAIREKTE